MLGNNRSGAYYSSGKRARDSLESSSSSRSLQPFLLGQATPRSAKRNRVSFGGGGASNNGGGGGASESSEWSSILSFNTPMRPSRLATLRRRETFSGVGSSSLCAAGGGSSGFVLRDKSERQSVARALQILDSRKRLRELSQNEQGPPPSPSPNSSSTAGGFLAGGGGSEADAGPGGSRRSSFNRKRRRLTINGALDAMRQEDVFASTSLRDIARQAGPVAGPSLQKRMFTTNSGTGEGGESAAPSSKRLRSGVAGDEVAVNGGLGDSSSEGSCRSSRRSLCGSLSSRLAERGVARGSSDAGRPASGSSGSAQRRLLSYLSPAQVEARYARRSAAGELARSHSCSNNSGTAGSGSSRRLGSMLSSRPGFAALVTTQAAQTDLSCDRTEVLQKSPVKEGEKEEAANDNKEERLHGGRQRPGPLSVADFVANLDRARGQRSGDSDIGSESSSGPLAGGSGTSDFQRRLEADSEARRNRLDRLRKLLSDVTREPPMPVGSVK